MQDNNFVFTEHYDRWHTIFVILSMDATSAFWPEMGLILEDTDTIKEWARPIVRDYREIENESSLSDVFRNARWNTLFAAFFQKIIYNVGIEAAAALYSWGETTFQYDSEIDAQTFIWRRLLRHLAQIGAPAYPLLELSLSHRKLNLLRRAIKKYLDNPHLLSTRIQTVEVGPLSDWDRGIFQTYTVDSSPMDWVLNTIEFVNTRSLWQEIVQILDVHELEILLEWGRKQTEVMGMSVESLRLLSFPDQDG